MTNNELIIIGSGGHARSCIDVIEHCQTFQISGLIGLPHELGTTVYGYPVIGTNSDLSRFSKLYQFALIGMGQIKSPLKRTNLYNSATELGFEFPIIISPMAYVSKHAQLGKGTIVLHRSTINAGARVGSNCIINSHSLIEHDAIVGDHCHIATGAILNGDVRVGEGSFIGSGSHIKQGVKIGRNCLVGMGVNVKSDLQDYSTVTRGDRA